MNRVNIVDTLTPGRRVLLETVNVLFAATATVFAGSPTEDGAAIAELALEYYLNSNSISTQFAVLTRCIRRNTGDSVN